MVFTQLGRGNGEPCLWHAMHRLVRFRWTTHSWVSSPYANQLSNFYACGHSNALNRGRFRDSR